VLGATVLLVAFGLVAGCAQTSDFPSDGASKASERVQTTSAKLKVPHWVDAGFAAANREIESRDPLSRPNLVPPSDDTRLPTKAEFVAAMLSVGINQKSAECIYQSVATGPVAKNAGKLVKALQAVGPSSRGEASGQVLSGLKQSDLQQMLVAIAPCMDSQTFIALLATLGGKGAQGGSALDIALAGLSPEQLAAVIAAGSSGDIASIEGAALAAGAHLSPAQLSALQSAALAGTFGALNPTTFDMSKVDPATMSAGQAAGFLFALAAGLTENQRQQLVRLANVNLSKINLNIDPSKLTSQQAGGLILLLSPFLSATLSPTSAGPPGGANPGQVYIPPGTDLSAINPLNFVSRENLVAGLMQQGIEVNAANCMYDKLRAIDPRLIGLAFTGGGSDGSSQVLLSIIGCAITG
jgi:hypothetical protein